MFYFKYIISFLFCLCFLSYTSYPIFANDMVLIPSGFYTPLFKYGDDASDDKIYVKSFMISKYPVTNFEFEKFVLNSEKWSARIVDSIFADKNYLSSWKDINISDIYDYPVVSISWFAADAYCSYIDSRLPTLDEWEYVASAGFYTADGKVEEGYLKTILDWYINSQTTGLSIISDMKKNYFGVFGLHGVIWEWVSDFNSVILLNTDSEGGGLEEILYCGATATNAIDPSDYVAFMRFAFRNTLEANFTSSNLGFRCVKDIY